MTSKTVKQPELLACPFCGGSAASGYMGDEDGGYGFVECVNREIKDGHFCGVHADDEAEAIAAWNTRTPTPQAAPSEAPADVADVVAKLLRERQTTSSMREGCEPQYKLVNPDGPEAAALITRLSADLAERDATIAAWKAAYPQQGDQP